MKTELANKIKSKGYWRIYFEPTDLPKDIKLAECKELVKKNSVNSRGWIYPYYPQTAQEFMDIEHYDNYYLGWIDWMGHLEFWHMYQSRQFIHYAGLREDWFEGDLWFGNQFKQYRVSEGEVLGLNRTMYFITEIFEFLMRLNSVGLYNGVKISIELHNSRNRKLLNENGVPFATPKICNSNEVVFEREYSRNEILSSSNDLAVEAIVHFCERFGWDNVPNDFIKNIQKQLLEENRQIPKANFF